MPILRKALYTTLLGATGATALTFFTTRHTSIRDVPPTDPIYSSASYLALNPLRNPVTQDVISRRLPRSKVKPALLKEEGKLVEAVTGGVFGGIAYAIQRAYLHRKYHSPATSTDLWTAPSILSSSFPIGTRVTDHFEVVERAPDSVTLRCGASPRERGVRESDGLFKVWVREVGGGEVEVGLTSVFFRGKGRAEEEPMGPKIKWLHGVYGRLLLEDAVRRVQV